MAIIEPSPPSDSVRELNSALPRVTRSAAIMSNAVRSEALAPPVPRHPHRVYILLLPEILAGRGLAAARLVGWRYILMEGPQSVAAAEVNTNDTETEHSFALIHEGQGSRSLEVLAGLEALPQVRNTDYELRLLRIPALMTVALWLHADPGGADILTPLPPANQHFAQGEVYTQSVWEAAMLDAARQEEALAQSRGIRSGPRPLY